MLRNRDHQNDEDDLKQDHKDEFERERHKIKALRIRWIAFLVAGVMFVVYTALYFTSRNRHDRFAEEGTGHLDRMRPGFDVGNFTIIPREDPEQKENCNSLDQAVRHLLANNQTKKILSRLCPESMWQWVLSEDGRQLCDSTPCKIDVAPGTDDGQIAELNALSLVCKELMNTFGLDGSFLGWSYGVIFSLLALALLWSFYHDRKAGAKPEERPLLEEQREEAVYYGANEEAVYSSEDEGEFDYEQDEEDVPSSVFSFGL